MAQGRSGHVRSSGQASGGASGQAGGAPAENPGASRRLGPSRRVNHRHRAPLLRILLLSPVQNRYHPPVPTGTAAQRQQRRSRRGQEDQRHLHQNQQQWGRIQQRWAMLGGIWTPPHTVWTEMERTKVPCNEDYQRCTLSSFSSTSLALVSPSVADWWNEERALRLTKV
ncbi:uncharacterized protein LOC144755033 isoform X2 [Lissotriton helveticus]